MSNDDATEKAWEDLNHRIVHGLSTQPETLALWNEIAPTLISCMNRRQIGRWAEPVVEFARLSPALAKRYLCARRTATSLTETEINRWTDILRKLANRSWKSIHLADALLGHSESLVAASDFESLLELAEILVEISEQNVELATSCLDSARRIFESMPRETLMQFLALARVVAANRRGDIWKYFERGSDFFLPFGPEAALEFVSLANDILRHPQTSSISILQEVAEAMDTASGDDQTYWFELAQRVAAIDALAAAEFLKAAPRLRHVLGARSIDAWVDRGIARALEVPAVDQATSCQAFFRLESASAGIALAELSERVDFSQVTQLLQLYGQAVAGESVVVKPHSSVNRDHHERTERSTGFAPDVILVPDHVDAFATRAENLGAYKVSIAHQAGRLLFDGQARDLDPETCGELHGDDAALAQVVFAIVKDGQIDARVREEYPGLAPALARLAAHALERRSSPEQLDLRRAFLENLVRSTLNSTSSCSWPESLIGIMTTAIGVLRLATRAGSTIRDVADVSLWLYRLAHVIPNIENGACPHPWRTLADSDIPSFDALPAPPSIPESLLNGGPVCEMADIYPPEFRGGFAPPIAGLPPRPAEVDADEIAEMMSNAELTDRDDPASVEVQHFDDAEGETSAEGEESEQHREHDEAIVWHDYDEWDCRLHGYRTAWCRVGERPIVQGDASVYEDILSRQYALIAALRRQFELMRPEYQRRVKNLHDGHDIDLEQAIRFFVDKKAGTGPVARFYTRRDKIERDVAAAFLFDMSHSTDEKVTATEDTRIIDVERDAAVLIIEAMEAIGDTYGIFGFSGHGREDVAYYTIKGLDEPLCATVKQRIAGVSPLGATRMGAAIRHTRSLLEQTPCAVQLLFLISDGRPQDKEYGNPKEPAGYGIHDTRQALIETARAGIMPFVITIDRQGPDYLETMCADLGYEVVKDVASLPGRLATIYRYLAGK